VERLAEVTDARFSGGECLIDGYDTAFEVDQARRTVLDADLDSVLVRTI